MQRLDITKAVKAISSVLPKKRPIGHHEPCAKGNEAKFLQHFVERGITSDDYIQWFEEKLRQVTGAEQAIVVSSGSAALHLALMAVGVKPNDEVLVPTLTYIATANAVVHAGAIPNFIDGMLCLNPYKLRCYLDRETVKNTELGRGRINKTTYRPITALIMVHLLGEPCDVKAIREITDAYGLILIEDSAEALGSSDGNTACGNMGDISILSFNHNKIVTTGGGGAILSNDPFLIAKAYHLAHNGRTHHPYLVEHDVFGWNYALPPVCAALGVAQLDCLPEFIVKKRKLNSKYFTALIDVKGLHLMAPNEGSNCWLNTVITDHAEDRDLLLEALHKEGIQARALFTPLHTLPFYQNNPRDVNLEYANHTAARAVCLPSGVGLL